MLITVMKAKIHRAVLTGAELNYEGSISIDKILLDKSGIFPNEKVQVVNLNNGSRLETYVIVAAPGSGEICLNGPAAHLGQKGDIVIIISYCHLHPDEIAGHKPIVIKVDKNNKPV
jgi:aspartate 1-decarboxylase